MKSDKNIREGLMQQLLTGKKRLDGFVGEWNTKKLSEIGKVNYGTRIVKGNVEEGEYFVYGGGGKTFTTSEYNRKDCMIVARFAMSKECARFVKGKFYLNDSGLTVESNSKTVQIFLDYLLYFNQHNIYKLRAGGAQQNLDVQAFKKMKFSIPNLEEQTAIAHILTTWDSGIEKLTQLIAAKREQKKGLMQQLLTGKKRLDGFVGEWREVKLIKIGKVNYGTRIVKSNVEEGVYFVYGGGGKTFTTKEYNREDCMIIARFAMSKKCARFVKGKFYLNDSGLTVESNSKTVQIFLDYLLYFNQHNIYKLRAGGAQQNLDVQAFKKMKFSIPNLEEQTAIAHILTTADKEIELLEKKLEAMKEEKKGLMQVLLTGKKRLIDS